MAAGKQAQELPTDKSEILPRSKIYLCSLLPFPSAFAYYNTLLRMDSCNSTRTSTFAPRRVGGGWPLSSGEQSSLPSRVHGNHNNGPLACHKEAVVETMKLKLSDRLHCVPH